MKALSCNRSEYLDANSDKALLDSIDPSLAHFADHLKSSHCSLAQVKTVYDQLDTASRRTFVCDEHHTKVSADLIAERFGIGPIRAQKTLRATT
jgi:hypothetical protein